MANFFTRLLVRLNIIKPKPVPPPPPPPPAPVIPGPCGEIFGEMYPIQEKTYDYYVAGSTNATEYEWNFPAGVKIISGANTRKIQVTFGLLLQGFEISVRGLNPAAGTKGPYSTKQIKIMPSPKPGPCGVITGEESTIAKREYTYSVTGSTDATNFEWTVLHSLRWYFPSSDRKVIRVTMDPAYPTETVTVKGTNKYGSGPTSKKVITVTPAPTPPSCGDIIGETKVIIGKDYEYYVKPIDKLAYDWVIPEDAKFVYNEKVNRIIVIFGEEPKKDVIAVRCCDHYGCGDYSKMEIEIVKG